jgi:hypothetical protein
MDTIALDRTVQVTCTGTDLVEFRNVRSLQGSLKVREQSDIDKIIKSILLHGFSFPFFIWKKDDKNYALDGHGRLKALAEMKKTGYYLDREKNLLVDDGPGWKIPPLPAVYIEAADMDEAKEKLLKLNSRYGMITEASFNLFTQSLKALDLSGISIKFEKIEINPPSVSAPLLAVPQISRPESIEKEAETYQPNLEPEIDIGGVSEKEMDKAAEKLETAMLHKGETKTIELCCPLCGDTFSVNITDVLVLIDEAQK